MNRTRYIVIGLAGVGISMTSGSVAYKFLAELDLPEKPAIVRKIDDANGTLVRLEESKGEFPYVTEDLTRNFPDVFSLDRKATLESAAERVRSDINEMQGRNEFTDYQTEVESVEQHNKRVLDRVKIGYLGGSVICVASMIAEMRRNSQERRKKRTAIN